MPIYVKFTGGTPIDGETKSQGYEKFVEFSSMQWGVGRGFASAVGTTGNRSTSAPSVSELTLTKITDTSSVAILQAALTDPPNRTVEVHVALQDGTKVQDFVVYTLENTGISGYSASSGGDKPSETVSLNFTKFTYKYCVYTDKGVASDSPSVTYDLTTASK
jgi:type VI secretion system secreted protein Hcp